MRAGFRLIMAVAVAGGCCTNLVVGEQTILQGAANVYVAPAAAEVPTGLSRALLKIPGQPASHCRRNLRDEVATVETSHRFDSKTDRGAGTMVIVPQMEFHLQPEDTVQWRGETYRRWKDHLLGPVHGGVQYLGMWRMEGQTPGVVGQFRFRPREAPDLRREFRRWREFRWQFPPQEPDEKPEQP